MPDQSLEEHRAGAPGRPLEDRPQRGDLIAVQIAAEAGSGSGTAWSPVTAGWRSRDEPGGGVAVDSLAPSLTLVLPIGDDTVGNTQIHRNGSPDRSISRELA